MFRLAAPQALYLFLLVPLLAVVYLAVWSWKKKQFAKFGNPDLLKQLTLGYSKRRPIVKFLLIEIILSLLILMLARPQLGTHHVEDEKMGIEVALMIDVSNSMYAQDVQPSRMDRTKLFLSTLIDALPNDKVSLGIFAGEAYPQLPITNDHISAKMFVETLSPGMVTSQGTNLASAIEFAQKSFSADSEVGKAIVIITDGEDHEEGAIEMAKQANEEGIQVYMIGVGTSQGTTIPMPDGGNLLDQNNRVVISSLNEDICKKVSENGGGHFFRLDETNRSQQLLLSELKKLTSTKGRSSFVEPNEQFMPIAVIVLFLLLVEFFMFETKNPIFRKNKSIRK
jgi:Ca-activated chloride channel family protein